MNTTATPKNPVCRLENLPLVVVLGPTASGKTAWAIKLAQYLDGEIICADSRTVYKGMTIGTAKPTAEEQAGVPHWGLDLVEPGRPFSVRDFQAYAKDKIAEIRGRGRLPLLVGGSGLYINSVIYNYHFSENTPKAPARHELEQMSLAELQNYVTGKGWAVDLSNKRRLIRAIERGGVSSVREPLLANTLVIGIKTERALLRERIEARAQAMLQAGFVDEVRQLLAQYGPKEQFKKNLYGVVLSYLNGEISEDELTRKMVAVDNQLVRKQLTWWRKPEFNADIRWFELSELNIIVENREWSALGLIK